MAIYPTASAVRSLPRSRQRVAGIFIASLGFAPGYAWLVALVFLGGAGIASFHPAGSSRVIANLEPERRQMAMAIFISCGSARPRLRPIGVLLSDRHAGHVAGLSGSHSRNPDDADLALVPSKNIGVRLAKDGGEVRSW